MSSDSDITARWENCQQGIFMMSKRIVYKVAAPSYPKELAGDRNQREITEAGSQRQKMVQIQSKKRCLIIPN